MRRQTIELVNIVAGNFCNLRCTHCVNDSGPDRSDHLTSGEIDLIASELNLKKPKIILFTGGEPSLLTGFINSILEQLTFQFKVKITTNGWFCKNEETMTKALNKFNKLSHIQLSYDAFHGSKLTVENVKSLSRECFRRNLKFNITMCIGNARDLITANQLVEEIGEKIVFQKVASIGRAKKNGISFDQPRFDNTILKKRCSNLDSLSYVHGKGFTFCCGPLVFESQVKIAHSSIAAHMDSEIRRKFETKTFGELLNDTGATEAELTPEMSHPCSLCHFIHCRSKNA